MFGSIQFGRLSQLFSFLSTQVDGTSSFARALTLSLPHGKVHTPVYMPVGTKGCMKGITSQQMESMGCQILLANTYHLASSLTTQYIQNVGGIHRYIAWDGNILTDSGGFQMVSFSQLSATTEEGVQFINPYTGQAMFVSPQRAVEQQKNIGADIVMALDDVVRPTSSLQRCQEATERTIRWIQRCSQSHKKQGQTLFPIIQGATDPSLRMKCLRELLKYAEGGIAIGGLSGGQDKTEFYRTVKHCCDYLPKDMPRYLMGVGYPIDLVLCSALGVDMFDCVFATRTARFGTAFTSEGSINLRNSQYQRDFRPIDEDCSCQTCRNYTRAYLHFIKKQDNCSQLLSIHNVYYLLTLMRELRQSILANRISGFVRSFVAGQYSRQERVPQWVEVALELAKMDPVFSGDSGTIQVI